MFLAEGLCGRDGYACFAMVNNEYIAKDLARVKSYSMIDRIMINRIETFTFLSIFLN